ncbi:MAG: response regulator transcription factor [Bdellovibrionales bacterium]
MQNLLVVEDDNISFKAIQHALESRYHLTNVTTVKDASEQLQLRKYDLILLDLILPDGNGYQIISYMKQYSLLKDIPTIILSSKISIENKVLGLNLGANDYMEKPFHPVELTARIENKINKNQSKALDKIIDLNQLKIDLVVQSVSLVSQNIENRINLTPIEFKILCYLAKHSHQVFSRDEIIEKIWGDSIHIQARNVDTHITSIRKKLIHLAGCIESVYGSGYRFNPDLALSSIAS